MLGYYFPLELFPQTLGLEKFWPVRDADRASLSTARRARRQRVARVHLQQLILVESSEYVNVLPGRMSLQLRSPRIGER